jgi:hypothetical protein
MSDSPATALDELPETGEVDGQRSDSDTMTAAR